MRQERKKLGRKKGRKKKKGDSHPSSAFCPHHVLYSSSVTPQVCHKQTSGAGVKEWGHSDGLPTRFPLTLLLTLYGASVRLESEDASCIRGPMGADKRSCKTHGGGAGAVCLDFTGVGRGGLAVQHTTGKQGWRWRPTPRQECRVRIWFCATTLGFPDA